MYKRMAIRACISSFHGHILITLLYLLSQTSALALHDQNVNIDTPGKENAQNPSTISAADVSTDRNIVSLSNQESKNSLKRENSFLNTVNANYVPVGRDSNSDLQFDDKTNALNTRNNILTSSNDKRTVHMRVASYDTPNITINNNNNKGMHITNQTESFGNNKKYTRENEIKLHHMLLHRACNDSSQLKTSKIGDSSAKTEVSGNDIKEVANFILKNGSLDTNNNIFFVACDQSCCNVVVTLADCSGCRLKCVPTDLPVNITVLLLKNNSISSQNLTNGTFSRYSELEELNIDSNNITDLPDGVFGGLGKLKILSMYNNSIQLNQQLNSSTVFCPLRNALEILAMHRNTKDKEARKKFLYPDMALSVLSKLSHLHIDGLVDKQFGFYFSFLTKLTHLYMNGKDRGYCHIGSITNDTFKYLKHLVYLDLSDCNINGGKVQVGAFSPLSSLQVLNVSFNLNLGIHNVGNFMYSLQNNTNFIHFTMVQIVPRFAPCVIVYKHTLRYFQNSRLQIIEAQNNEIEMIEVGALDMLPSTLKVVNLTNNKIMFGAYWRDLAHLTVLEALYVDGYKSPEQFPYFFPTSKWSCYDYLFKNSSEIEQTKGKGCPCVNSTCPPDSNNFVLPLPPELKLLSMHTSSLAYNVGKLLFCPENSLTTVDLSANVFEELQGPVIGLNNITSLRLTSCFIETIGDNFFDNLTSLQYLNLFQNLLGDRLNNDIPGRIFESLDQLVYLNLSFNNLYRLNAAAFKNLKNLQFLDISTNRIGHINFTVGHMKNLTFLDLHKNDLLTLPKSLMDLVSDLLASNKSVTIDMSSNPISCDCTNLAFLEWVVTTKIFGNNYTHYYCKSNIENLPAIEMRNGYDDEVLRLKKACSTHVIMFLTVAGGTLILVVFIVGLLIYRFRWTLRYWFHAAKLKIYSSPQQTSEDYDYDVFVSYASEDTTFVVDELKPQLNDNRHLRLMIHGEKFQVGRHIADNIYTAVRQCRKTLVLVTTHMLKSHWCTYELQMARQESIRTGRDILLFLFLEEIPTYLLNADVLVYIKSSTYIIYPVDVSHRQTFWDKLANDLKA